MRMRPRLTGLSRPWLICLCLVAATPSLTTGEPARCQVPVQQPDGAESFQLTDHDGRSLRLPALPRRIICLGPSLAGTLDQLGAGPLVVGADRFSAGDALFPGARIVGTPRSPNLELIAELEPDLILVSNLSPRHRGILGSMGLQVASLHPTNLREVGETVKLLGRITDRRAEAARIVAEMSRSVQGVKEALDGLPPQQRPVVFIEVWHSPLRTAGPGTFIHEVVELAGGVNLARDAPAPWPLYDLERLLERDPQAIITADTHSYSQLRGARRTGWGGIEAVRRRKVLWLDPDRVWRAGPHLAGVIEEIAHFLHPGLFPNPENIPSQSGRHEPQAQYRLQEAAPWTGQP